MPNSTIGVRVASRRVLLALLSVLACGAQPCVLTIAAASDLAPLQNSFVVQFKKTHSCKLVFTFSSSGQLASQIEQGAPYDLYLSASQDLVRKLADRGLVERASIVVFARGRLGLWAPASSQPIDLRDLSTAQYKKISIANPSHAPYGMAAKQALQSVGHWGDLKDKLVLAENVRQALQFAETGNVDAVIASWSLLRTKPGASLLDLKLHQEIRHTAGIVKRSSNQASSRAFADWLARGEGRKILQEAGFY